MTPKAWPSFNLLIVGSLPSTSFKNVLRNQYQIATHITAANSRKKIIGTTFSVTLLNPHVYLDTVMILGSVGDTFDGNEKWAFAIDTILASVLRFYTFFLRGFSIFFVRFCGFGYPPKTPPSKHLLYRLIYTFLHQ